MRNKTTVIVSKLKGVRAIHFTNQPLSGADNDVWFPIFSEDLFRSIENIMVINNQAKNLTLVQRIRELSVDCSDYEVIYNSVA